jgi:hypothetical protein
MGTNAKRRDLHNPGNRTAYRTLRGWALGTLIEHGAVRECDDHGHRRDRSDPDARSRAFDEARHNPFPGTSVEASVAALEEVLQTVGDTCPDCK